MAAHASQVPGASPHARRRALPVQLTPPARLPVGRGAARIGRRTPRTRRVDTGGLQQSLQQWQSARVGQFVSDTPGSDLEPYGLQAPNVTLSFNQGTNNVLTVEFGRSPANNPAKVYARRSNYPTI